MALFDTSCQNPLGLHPGPVEKVRAYARGGAITKGMVVRFDVGATDGDVTAAVTFGGASNPTSNILAATSSHNGYQTTLVYLYGVAMEAIANDGQGWVCIRGLVQAQSDGTANAAGTGLAAAANSRLAAVGDEVRCCAIAAEAMDDDAGDLSWVFFDGINGFAITGDVAN